MAAKATLTSTAASAALTPTAAGATLTPTAAEATLTPTAAGATFTSTVANAALTFTAARATLTPTAGEAVLTLTAAGAALTPTAAALVHYLDQLYTAKEAAKNACIQTALENLAIEKKKKLTKEEIEHIPDIPDECFLCANEFNYTRNFPHLLIFCCRQ